MSSQSRRRFLAHAAFAGAAGLGGFLASGKSLAAEGPPETTSLRIEKVPAVCNAPQHIAEELLRAEGFTDIRHVDTPVYAAPDWMARGEIDFGMDFAGNHVSAIDRGVAITVLTGVHVGCFELFAREGIRSVADLKGKSVGVPSLGSSPHRLIAIWAAQVGIDPGTDINWVVSTTAARDLNWVVSAKPMQLFIDGKIDAFLPGGAEGAELRARQIGHVIVNTAVDRPWSQYFCCLLAGNREFVRNYPVATKRVLRAILKAADLCATDPAGAAQRLVDGGFTPRYDYAFDMLSGLPYDKWREYDAEDTLRFYALRLRETGFIKSSPQKIIADGTDWRFLNELKRELKA